MLFLVKEIEELKKELKVVRGFKMPPKLMATKSTETEEEDEFDIVVNGNGIHDDED